jgi:hypothetical protein
MQWREESVLSDHALQDCCLVLDHLHTSLASPITASKHTLAIIIHRTVADYAHGFLAAPPAVPLQLYLRTGYRIEAIIQYIRKKHNPSRTIQPRSFDLCRPFTPSETTSAMGRARLCQSQKSGQPACSARSEI